MRILFLPGAASSPSARYRILQFIPYLEKVGHQIDVHIIHPERTKINSIENQTLQRIQGTLVTIQRIASLYNVFLKAPQYDVIMLNRDIIPERKITFLEPLLASRNPRLIFDFDDAIHLYRDGKMRKILPYFALLTPGNEYLAEYARTLHSNVHIWPTVVDTNYYRPCLARRLGIIRLGWTGSSSTRREHLPLLEPVLTQLAKNLDFEFVVIADQDPRLRWHGVATRFIAWNPLTEIEDIQQIDIGLMPLNDTPFTRGKCAFKAIQYMAAGIPAIVSPIGASVSVVLDGETGIHATSDEEWIEHLQRLANDVQLRTKMGEIAREHVVANFSIKYLLPRMLETFEHVSSLQ